MRPRIGITSAPVVQEERRFERLNRWYAAAVLEAGGLPLILPTLPPTAAGDAIDALDGLVLSGGGDVDPRRYGQEPAPEVYDVNPDRDGWEAALIAAATGAGVPLLGICRGMQLLNVEAGGTLVQHLPDITSEDHRQRQRDREPVHNVEIAPGSRLAAVLGTSSLGVNSIHHQAVDRLGAGLKAVAWAPDGVVEALESEDRVLAVQWHPEAMLDDQGLFPWLVRAANRAEAHR